MELTVKETQRNGPRTLGGNNQYFVFHIAFNLMCPIQVVLHKFTEIEKLIYNLDDLVVLATWRSIVTD
mgnify:CR=1 FL=1